MSFPTYHTYKYTTIHTHTHTYALSSSSSPRWIFSLLTSLSRLFGQLKIGFARLVLVASRLWVKKYKKTYFHSQVEQKLFFADVQILWHHQLLIAFWNLVKNDKQFLSCLVMECYHTEIERRLESRRFFFMFVPPSNEISIPFFKYTL